MLLLCHRQWNPSVLLVDAFLWHLIIDRNLFSRFLPLVYISISALHFSTFFHPFNLFIFSHQKLLNLLPPVLHILLYAFRRLRTGYGEDMQICKQAFTHAISQKGWDSALCCKGSDNMKLGCVFHTVQLSHDCCVSSPILWFHGQNHQLRNGVCLVHDLRIACLLFADDVFLLVSQDRSLQHLLEWFAAV